MTRAQKLIEADNDRRRLEFAPRNIDVSTLRASVSRELPKPVSAKANDTERNNTPN